MNYTFVKLKPTDTNLILLERKLPFADTLLKGIGQIMLQESALTGLLFLAGLFYGSVVIGIAAFVGVLCGTLTAKALGYDKAKIQQGLYGFSPTLVGVALLFYFQPVFVVWGAVVVGSALAAMLQHFFIRKKIPVFTLPFIIITWVMMWLLRDVYPVAAPVLPPATMATSYDFTAALKGYGQVIFQGSALVGFIFFLAVFINMPIAGLYGLAGAVLAAVLSARFSAPIDAVSAGLFSYNAVLCAIAFAGDKPKNGFWALIAVMLSVLITFPMTGQSFMVLTFPFVAATCITLLLKKATLFFC